MSLPHCAIVSIEARSRQLHLIDAVPLSRPATCEPGPFKAPARLARLYASREAANPQRQNCVFSNGIGTTGVEYQFSRNDKTRGYRALRLGDHSFYAWYGCRFQGSNIGTVGCESRNSPGVRGSLSKISQTSIIGRWSTTACCNSYSTERFDPRAGCSCQNWAVGKAHRGPWSVACHLARRSSGRSNPYLFFWKIVPAKHLISLSMI